MVLETLLIGLVVALLWTEAMEYHPGGLIVPGYLALHLDKPLRVLATIGIAFLVLGAYELLSRRLVLFGRRRFVMMILAGALFAELWLLAAPHLFSAAPELRAIGWIVPGLLANNMKKQKAVPTLASAAAASILTFAIVELVRIISR